MSKNAKARLNSVDDVRAEAFDRSPATRRGERHAPSPNEDDGVFARNDHGKYDAAAPTERRAKDDVDGLHDILGNRLKDMSQTQLKIIVEEFRRRTKGANIAARRAISVHACDTHRKAAFCTWRDSMTTGADSSTEIDLPDRYGRIEATSKRHAARQRRRASRKKENRSRSGGDRSKFEGDRSKSRSDLEENARARDVSVAAHYQIVRHPRAKGRRRKHSSRRPAPCRRRWALHTSAPRLCVTARTVVFDTTAMHDTTATAHDTTVASHDTTVALHDTSAAFQYTTMILAASASREWLKGRKALKHYSD